MQTTPASRQGARRCGVCTPHGDAVGSAAAPWTYDGLGRLNVVPGVVTATT